MGLARISQYAVESRGTPVGESTRISHKIRRERPEIECWCGFRADERVKLGRHLQSRPATVRSTGRGIQRSPHQCRDSGAQ